MKLDIPTEQRETGLAKSSAWLKKLEDLSGRKVEARHAKKTVYIAIDCSGSMGDGLLFPMRTEKLDYAKKGAIGFAEEAISRGYAVGLVRFSTHAEVMTQPTIDAEPFREAVAKLYVHGSTNMAAAIEIPLNYLNSMTGERVICLVTDGQPDNPNAALAMAREAKKQRIDIMAIGTDDADRRFLDQLVTRKELSVKVERENLQQGIASMAKLLKG